MGEGWPWLSAMEWGWSTAGVKWRHGDAGLGIEGGGGYGAGMGMGGEAGLGVGEGGGYRAGMGLSMGGGGGSAAFSMGRTMALGGL